MRPPRAPSTGPVGVIRVTVAEVGAAAWLLYSAGRGVAADALEADDFSERRWAQALDAYVWRPLPTVVILAALSGLIAGLLAAQALAVYTAERQIVPPLAGALVGQLTPVLVGLFAAGRVSVALAARLGAMRLSGELDALELRGFAPARFVLAPALAAMLVAAPVLTVGGAAAAILAAGVVLQMDATLPWPSYLDLVLTPSLAAEALKAVVKAGLFVVLAVGAGATAGASPVRDARDLERRTSVAFNSGILAVFTAAALFAAFGF